MAKLKIKIGNFLSEAGLKKADKGRKIAQADEGVKVVIHKSGRIARGDLVNDERKYVIVCNEHSGNWPGAILFWGHRTQDSEERSFGGYTSDIDSCELYSENEVKGKGYHFPRYYEGMSWEEFRGCDDVLIEPGCLEKLGYKQTRMWYKQ